MSLLGDRPAPAAATPPRRGGRWVAAAHLVAGGVVMTGVLAQLVRPLAPPLSSPPDPAVFFGPEHLARVAAYTAPLTVVRVAGLALQVAVPLLVISTPPGRRVIGMLGRGRSAPLVAAAVATGMVVLVDLALLPLNLWAGFVHEGAWGFRTQGLGGWARDWLILRAPGWAAVAAGAGGLAVAVRRLPRAWPPVAGLAGAALTLLLVGVAPAVLEPLQFRFSPLADGPVRAEVERVLAAAGADIDTILVADASRRTTKENAYVSGLAATRRVVLHDTLLAGRSPEEVGLVLAHELGHARNADVARGALLAAAGAVGGAYALAGVQRRRRRRGLAAAPGDPWSVAAAVATLLVLGVVALPAETWVSRRAEAAADLASLDLTEDPQTFLAMQEGLSRANLSDPAPPAWARLLWWTHPPAAARLQMGVEWGGGG